MTCPVSSLQGPIRAAKVRCHWCSTETGFWFTVSLKQGTTCIVRLPISYRVALGNLAFKIAQVFCQKRLRYASGDVQLPAVPLLSTASYMELPSSGPKTSIKISRAEASRSFST